MSNGNASLPELPEEGARGGGRIPSAAEFLKVLAALEAEFKAELDVPWSAPPPAQPNCPPSATPGRQHSPQGAS